jgi:Family of unknown function (DUF5824)
MSLRGGEIWKEGADTCVFKPAVRCEGELGRQPNAVSRIVKADQATRDLEIETLIREKFPYLVEAEVVTVHTKACTPIYMPYDLDTAKNFQPAHGNGCYKADILATQPGVQPDHVNMVTPLRDITFYKFLKEHPEFRPGWKRLIEGILQAAISMVPDDGPWVIHTDCHLNNILTIPKGEAEAPGLSLSDWGRALIIQNPKDIQSVRQGVRDWAKSIPYLAIPKDLDDDKELVSLILRNLGDYPQHPAMYHNSFELVFSEDPMKQKIGLSKFRSWLPYVLITETYSVVNYVTRSIMERDAYRALAVGTDTQQILGDRVFQFLFPESEPSGDTDPELTDSMSAARHSGGVYWPKKYFTGLTKTQNLQRKRSATRRTKMSSKDPKAYVPFKSDKGVKTRKSSYTERFHRKYPGATSLPEIAKATGISKGILQEVYDRGMAAWRTGHRPGASQQAWGMARVHSFALKGKTYRTADADLARKV